MFWKKRKLKELSEELKEIDKELQILTQDYLTTHRQIEKLIKISKLKIENVLELEKIALKYQNFLDQNINPIMENHKDLTIQNYENMLNHLKKVLQFVEFEKEKERRLKNENS